MNIVQNLWEVTCLKAGKLKEQCKALVHIYVEIIFVSAIDSMTPAKKACVKLSMCERDKLHNPSVISSMHRLRVPANRMAREHGLETPKPSFCDVCMMTVEYWEVILQVNQTMEALELGLRKMCDVLPLEYEEKCRAMATQYGDKIIDFIHRYQNPGGVCESVFVCPAPQLAVAQPFALDPFCDACKQLTSYLAEQFQLNRTEKAMEESLRKVCETLPNDREDYCKVIVNNYGQLVLRYINDIEDPTTICQLMLLCLRRKSLLPAMPISLCASCRNVATFLEKELQRNDTERRSVVNQYGSEIIEMLRNGQKPDEICKVLMLCLRDWAVDEPIVNVCPLCQRVVFMIERLFRLNETELLIKNDVASFCTLLAAENEKKCLTMVNHYGDEIIKQLATYKKPLAICKSLLYCPPDAPAVAKPSKEIACQECSPLEQSVAAFLPSRNKKFIKVIARNICQHLEKQKVQIQHICHPGNSDALEDFKENTVCDNCKQIVAYLKGAFKINETMEALKIAVAGVCNIFPYKQEEECIKMVSRDGNIIVSFVQAKVSPDAVCKSLYVYHIRHPVALQKFKENTACDTCKQVVAFLEGAFKMNETMEALKIAIEVVCVIFPEKQEKECIAMVSTNADRIIGFVRDQAKPEAVCKLLLVCPRITALPVAQTEYSICRLCQETVKVMKILVNLNKTQMLLKFINNNLCYLLPSQEKTKCEGVLKYNSDEIFQMLRNGTKPIVFCQFIFVCSKSNHRALLIERNELSFCPTCKIVVTFLESFLPFNASELLIKFAMKSMCNVLPSERKTECTKTIDNFVDPLVDMIRNRTNPAHICYIIFQCPTSELTRFEETKGQWLCETCRQIIVIMKRNYWINRPEAHQIITLKQSCNLLSSMERTTCKMAIDTNKKQITTLIRSGMKPEIICKRLMACPAVSTVEEENAKARTCDTCKQVVAFLEGALKINQTMLAMGDAVEQMCSIFPKNKEILCKAKFAQYADTIIALAQKGISPSVICQILYLCPLSPSRSVATVQEDSLCDSCKQAVAFVEDAFKVNQTVEAVKVVALQMCSILPKQQEEECRDKVSKYAEIILTLVQLKMNPTDICIRLQFCCLPSENFLLKRQNTVMVCEACTQVVAYLEGALKINQTMESAKLIVMQACNLLPASEEAECVKDFLEKADAIIKFIQMKMNPSAICRILFLCPPGRVCETCKQTLAFVEEAFQINQTLASLKATIINMCSILPLEEETQCENVVKQYSDQLIALIQMRLRPFTICKILFLCGLQPRLRKMTRYNSGPYCNLCRAAVTSAQQTYTLKKNEENLMNAVGTMCHTFPEVYKVKCNKMVHDNGKSIISKLRQSHHPALICKSLDLCVHDAKWSRSGCDKGERYWCFSFSNTLKCKALKYCNLIRA